MRADGGGELASRRNKKARDFTQPFFHKSTLLSTDRVTLQLLIVLLYALFRGFHLILLILYYGMIPCLGDSSRHPNHLHPIFLFFIIDLIINQRLGTHTHLLLLPFCRSYASGSQARAQLLYSDEYEARDVARECYLQVSIE